MSIFARGGFFINEDFVDSDYDIIQLDWTVDGELEKKLRVVGQRYNF